jgi:hypothetical protein
MKDNLKKQMMLVIGMIIVVAGILILNPSLLSRFEVVDIDNSNYILVTTALSSLEQANATLSGENITRFYNGENYTFKSGDSLYYFTSNVSESCINAPFFYDSLHIPTLQGTNKICKYSLTLVNDSNEVKLEEKFYYTLYTKEQVTSKQLCESLGGNYTNSTCTCPNGDKWNETSVNKTCGPIKLDITSKQLCESLGGNYTNSTCTCPNGDIWYDNSTSKVCGPITVTKTVEKEIAPTFMQKYGTALLVLVIIGVAFFLNSKKKRRK